MSNRLKKHLPLLKLLKKANVEERIALLENTNNDFIKCLDECIDNFLRGNVRCSHVKREQLKKSAKVLRKIVHPKTSIKRKRELLVQRGGFLPALLAPLIGVASGLIGDLLGNLINK